jgi:hypothetical protein
MGGREREGGMDKNGQNFQNERKLNKFELNNVERMEFNARLCVIQSFFDKFMSSSEPN